MRMRNPRFFRLSRIIFLLIFGSIGYVGYHVSIFHYDYYDLRTEAREVLHYAKQKQARNIKEKFLNIVKRKRIPIDKHDVKFTITKTRARIQIEYQEVLRFMDYEIHVFDFKIDETREFRY